MNLLLRIRSTSPAPSVPLVPPCLVWLIASVGGKESCLLHGKMFPDTVEELVEKLGNKVKVQREKRT